MSIPAGAQRRGYAKARVEVRHLLDGRWRVYYKDQLLLETQPPKLQAPLPILRRRRRSLQEVTFSLSSQGNILSRLHQGVNPSCARNLIPALGRFFIRPARVRVTVDDGSSTQGCEVHDASGG